MVSRILVSAGVKGLLSGSALLIPPCLLEKEPDPEQCFTWNGGDGEERLYPLCPEGVNFCFAASRKFYFPEETLSGNPSPGSAHLPGSPTTRVLWAQNIPHCVTGQCPVCMAL